MLKQEDYRLLKAPCDFSETLSGGEGVLWMWFGGRARACCLVVVVQTYDPSTQEAETGGFRFWGQPRLHIARLYLANKREQWGRTYVCSKVVVECLPGCVRLWVWQHTQIQIGVQTPSLQLIHPQVFLLFKFTSTFPSLLHSVGEPSQMSHLSCSPCGLLFQIISCGLVVWYQLESHLGWKFFFVYLEQKYFVGISLGF